MNRRRLLALLLSALLLLPGLMGALGKTNADAESDIWVQIAEYEEQTLAEHGVTIAEASESSYAAMIGGVIGIVENWDGYVPGSIERHGDFFFWDGVDGTGYGYSPRLRANLRSETVVGGAYSSVEETEVISYAAKDQDADRLDVAVFEPYYGMDTSFTNQYRNEGKSIAQASGGVCTVYQGNDATIDNIAHAVETCGVVIFDSHGDTDYANGSNYTARANTSYLCLQTGAGLTAEDQATVQGPYGSYKHAYYAGAGYNGMKYYCVDGTAIANHMNGTAPENLLWMAICLGMATDGMEAPLRECGVEVVYGYSQSVTFTGDYAWEKHFWTKMKEGSDVKDAIAYMKQQVGIMDPYESNYPAYPIVVSSEDVYPGHGNVDKAQTVNSTWKLPALPTLYGDVNCDGRITAADAALVLQALVGCEMLKPQSMKNAMVSGGTELTAMDAILILRRIVQLIDVFPAEE